MRRKLTFGLLSILLIFSAGSVLPGGSEKEAGTITFAKKLQYGEVTFGPGTFTVRIKDGDDGKRILLVQDNVVKVDALAIDIPLERSVTRPVITVEKMRSDDLMRLKVKADSEMLLVYFKII